MQLQTVDVKTQVSKPAPIQPTSDEPVVFNVTSSNKSVSGNRMLEQRIQLSLKNGDTASALKDLNNLLALEPRNGSARKRLASLEFAQSNPKRASFLLDQGIKLSPQDSSMRLMQARLLFRENRNVQALTLLNAHPQNVIADNDLLSFRAALAEKQKDYSTSLQDYSTLLQRQPKNARWMLGLAISQDKQEMHEQAVTSYKKVKSSNQLSTQVVSFVDSRLAALVGS
jgi:MSHA biogenesis protein MshN